MCKTGNGCGLCDRTRLSGDGASGVQAVGGEAITISTVAAGVPCKSARERRADSMLVGREPERVDVAAIATAAATATAIGGSRESRGNAVGDRRNATAVITSEGLLLID